jgi:ATP-binding cassette subfamily F protein uup
LIADLDVLLLDEPTNHLDVEVVAWLADYLKAQSKLAVVIVTHDRWFLDALCERTWEVVGGAVEEYEGGYSSFVLAKAERFRQASASEARRQNLMRKELAWLRRGAPARTTKPKFRIEAANELISNEPPPRDSVELLSFAGSRLGKTVYELNDATLTVGQENADGPIELLDHCTWNIGPGDRIGIIGSNGAGKTSLIRMLVGEVAPSKGAMKTGVTVKVAYLSQHLEELNPKWRVLEAVEHVASRVDLGKGRELTASQLCESLGFSSDAQWTQVGDLSGGERRRLQLTRLLMNGPNVLILDEPTNDFDVETLTALEDLLDGFAGTLLVISHDRYFLERVCDDFVGLYGDRKLSSLTGGIDEYLAVRRSQGSNSKAASSKPVTSAADQRVAAKAITRTERQIEKLDKREHEIHDELIEHATNLELIATLNAELLELQASRVSLENLWLELTEAMA